MGRQSMQKRVIVNADDFGFSPGITEGILRAHREGVVTSTTIAANMPAAEDAVRRLAEAPDLGLGVHLNACQGPPLSSEGKRLAGADGQMRWTAPRLFARCLVPGTLGAIEAEFDAQIRWVLDHGLRPTHLDSHRHVHGFPPVFLRVVKLARRYHIPFVRWPRERLLGGGWPAAAKQRRVVRGLRLCSFLNRPFGLELRGTLGTWGIAHTGRIDAAWLVLAAERLAPGVTEIMTHPGLVDDLEPATSRLHASRQIEMNALCDGRVRETFNARGVELIDYGRIR
jgi:chitin disaccharide deacetylase